VGSPSYRNGNLEENPDAEHREPDQESPGFASRREYRSVSHLIQRSKHNTLRLGLRGTRVSTVRGQRLHLLE